MRISVGRLWLGAAILWSSTVVYLSSGLVVDADEDPVTDLLPDVLARREERNDRRRSNYDTGMIGGPLPDDEEVAETPYNQDDLSCTELRSKRYISDGFCTSAKPITEVVCAGECVPNVMLDLGADFTKVWAVPKTKEWRCVNDVVRQRRVHLVCDNNERRTYRIRTVKSCKCKRYEKRHNESNVQNANENANGDRQSRDDKPSREERRRDRKEERRQNVERSNRRRDRENR